MDKSQLVAHLETARSLIAAHGIVAHMTEYSRSRLGNPVTPEDICLRFEFCLDPKKATWDPSNASVTLALDFRGGDQFEVDGDTLRNYKSRVRVSFSAGDVDVDSLRRRENMMSTVVMLMEMLTTTLPQQVTLVVATAQQKADEARKRELLDAGKELGRFIESSATKGLRTGGKSRTVPFPTRYIEKHGAPLADGVYPYKQVRRWNRRGDASEVANYSLRVRVNYAGEQIVIINRV